MLLALPTLAMADPSFFGVEIQDRIPAAGYLDPPVALDIIVSGSPDKNAPLATGFLTGVQATTASGSISGSGWDMYHAQYGTAAAAASGFAEIGRLGATASLSASSTDSSPYPYAGDGFMNRAQVGFTLSAKDDLLVSSASLANGTPVDVRFTLTLNSQVTGLSNRAYGHGLVGAELTFDAEGGPTPWLNIGDSTSGAPALRTVTQTISLNVGSTYRLWQSLEVSGLGDASWTGNSSVLPGPASFSLDILADHTSYAFADVLGDATLVSASGHDYSFRAPVPMPPSAALTLVGLCLLGVALRRSGHRTFQTRY
jgi:hypothetical protein